MQIVAAMRLLWLLWVALMCIGAVCGSGSGNNEGQLQELLSTETTLIDTLRDYIDALDKQLEVIKRETLTIEQIHRQVGDGQVMEHMGNPLNVLTILKRFQSIWPLLEQQANATHKLAKNQPQLDSLQLQLPSEEDYETALLNLLHLQSVYNLKPASLSLGVVNGLKLGSVMSWSDCLEMARNSDQIGDYAVAKYWLETALDKLPAASNVTTSISERERGKVQILEASLNMDYSAGELLSALTTAKELLLLRPANKNVQKAKTRIEKAINETKRKLLPRTKSKAKFANTVEQMLHDELCRATSQESHTGSRFNHCRQDIVELRLQRLEQLSEDPYIMLYHDVFSSQQTDQLISLLDDNELQLHHSKDAAFAPLQISKLGQKRLSSIIHQLAPGSGKPYLWQARRHSHEHVMAPKEQLLSSTSTVARAMLNLQESKLGGALVFPQLELGVNVPRGSLVYWRTRSSNEFPGITRSDYRSRQLICPVLLGAQLTVWTELS